MAGRHRIWPGVVAAAVDAGGQIARASVSTTPPQEQRRQPRGASPARATRRDPPPALSAGRARGSPSTVPDRARREPRDPPPGWRELRDPPPGWRELRDPRPGWRELRDPRPGWRELRDPRPGWRELRDPRPGWRELRERPRTRRGPPDRTRDFVWRRSSRLRRAAWRIGGPDWGLRAVMSLIIAVMLLTVTGFAFERITGADVLPDGPAARFWPAPRDFPVLERSLPTRIRARAVRIEAPVHAVGDTPGGSIDVPKGERFDEAGWYEKGPTPGEYGPAVIVGHVDRGDGPSVFHRLARLRPGNRVEVTRADGKVAVFEVNKIRRYDRDELPAGEVFGDFSRPGLRLITCGGRWVGGTTGYADNIVVYASLVRTRDTRARGGP